jgi:hypothetical protein
MREINLRLDRSFQRIDRTLAQWHEDSLRASREHAVMIKNLEDLREESIAQRGALLALIDEMRGNGPAPAT